MKEKNLKLQQLGADISVSLDAVKFAKMEDTRMIEKNDMRYTSNRRSDEVNNGY